MAGDLNMIQGKPSLQYVFDNYRKYYLQFIDMNKG